jgi:hypothetical protein
MRKGEILKTQAMGKTTVNSDAVLSVVIHRIGLYHEAAKI